MVEVEAAQRALKGYERILGPRGPHSDSADEIQQLGDKLVQSDKDKAALRLRLTQAESVRDSCRNESHTLI